MEIVTIGYLVISGVLLVVFNVFGWRIVGYGVEYRALVFNQRTNLIFRLPIVHFLWPFVNGVRYNTLPALVEMPSFHAPVGGKHPAKITIGEWDFTIRIFDTDLAYDQAPKHDPADYVTRQADSAITDFTKSQDIEVLYSQGLANMNDEVKKLLNDLANPIGAEILRVRIEDIEWPEGLEAKTDAVLRAEGEAQAILAKATAESESYAKRRTALGNDQLFGRLVLEEERTKQAQHGAWRYVGAAQDILVGAIDDLKQTILGAIQGKGGTNP